MILGLVFGWRDVADRLEQPAVVEPVDPFERGVFHRVEIAPWTAAMDELRLEQPNDRLGHGVVVGIADTAHRGLRTELSQALRVADRKVLAAAVAVVHHAMDSRTRPDRLLQSIENQLGVHRARRTPADDAAREHVDREGHVPEAGPGGDVGEVRDPQLVRPACMELPIDVIERSHGSNTSRTARSLTSGENLFCLLMTPSSQEMESPGIPG